MTSSLGARTKLSYPLYGADFDPFNADFLLVGGGGGSTSSGLPNKISLLDTSRRNALTPIADLELPKTEDSVTSLAVVQSSETSLTALAGVNGSAADQATGKNQHLRSFRVRLPPKKGTSDTAIEKAPKETATIEEVARTSLFRTTTGMKMETYQRITRVSPSIYGTGPRIVGIASGLATSNEIILVDSSSSPQSDNELARIDLGKNQAADLDFAPVEGNDASHTLAYCTDYEVFVYELQAGKASLPSRPRSVYSNPEASGGSKQPKFRALRFVSPRHLLLLRNRPDRAGVDLVILKLAQDGTSGAITLQKQLSSAAKAATGLDVCLLSSAPSGERQIIIAVSSQNNSIEMLTIDYSKDTGLSTFRPYRILKDVHAAPITKMAFSTFVPPSLPINEDTRLQLVKLASVSVDQTVVVHTFSLRSFPPKRDQTRRHVLVPPGSSNTLQTAFNVFIAVLVGGLVALLLQVFFETSGLVRPTLGVAEWLQSGPSEVIANPSSLADTIQDTIPTAAVSSVSSAVTEATSQTPTTEDVQQKLHELVREQSALETPKAIIIRDTGGDLSTETHRDVDQIKEEKLTKWEDLKEHQKESWKQKLMDAGHWTVDLGEGVLLGVFFSELAGFAAEVVGPGGG